MTAFGFQKNTVFSWKSNQYQVIKTTPQEQIVIEKIDDASVEVVQIKAILAAYRMGDISFLEPKDSALEKYSFSRSFRQLPAKEQDIIRRRKHYIDCVLEQGEPRFTKEYLEPLLVSAARKIEDREPPSCTTFYRWYRSYKLNPDTRGLRPKFDRRGRRKEKFCPLAEKLLINTLEEAYNVSPQTTISNIYNNYIHYIERENENRLIEQKIHKPSESTFRRKVKSLETYDLVVLKKGKAFADKSFRTVKQNTVSNDILERVEVDHTPLDLFLIDKKTGMPLGRPTVTVLIDHYSRMVLGYYISYQGPSTAAVLAALRHSILPKEKREGHERLQIEHDWISHGLPDKLVVDNGMEFHSHDLESVSYDLGIHLEFCPKHEPRFKAVVERYLKNLNYTFASQIPGASFAKWHIRDDYDPLKHAVFDIEDFVYLFEKWVLDIYAQSLHKTINKTPYAKWKEGEEKRSPKLPLNAEQIHAVIGKTVDRSLRNDGIQLLSIHYQSQELGSIIRRYGTGVKVRVVYNPEDLSAIQVYGPDNEAPITVLASDQAYTKNLTELQHRHIRRLVINEGNKYVDAKKLSKAKFDLSQFIIDSYKSKKLNKSKKGAKLSGLSSNKPKADMERNHHDSELKKPYKRGPFQVTPNPNTLQLQRFSLNKDKR